MSKEPVLCYVEDQWAFFTTKNLAEQWGDDWDDAPYEHNAGRPYDFHDATDGREGRKPWTIVTVAWDGNFEPPCEGHLNSPYSVQSINAGAAPWLITSKWHNGPLVVIPAGVTLSQFCELIGKAGGQVYLPQKAHNEQ